MCEMFNLGIVSPGEIVCEMANLGIVSPGEIVCEMTNLVIVSPGEIVCEMFNLGIVSPGEIVCEMTNLGIVSPGEIVCEMANLGIVSPGEIVCEMTNLGIVSPGEIVCEMEEEHLWESKQLGAHSPYVLLSTLIYFNTCYFHLRTVDDHLHLSFSHIMKHWKKLNIPGAKLPGRSVYLRYYVPTPIGKTRRASLGYLCLFSQSTFLALYYRLI